MQQPPGYQQGSNLVCGLNKAIYGLKQAPRVWFDKLKATLYNMGFQSTKSDNSLFIRIDDTVTIYILIYVDDLIVTGNSDAEISKITRHLDREFSIKNIGNVNYFLDIEVKRISQSEVMLCQTKYIRELLNKSKMTNANPQPTPMISGQHLSKNRVEVILNDK